MKQEPISIETTIAWPRGKVITRKVWPSGYSRTYEGTFDAPADVTEPHEMHGHANAGSVSPEYQTWCHMIRRCHDPESKDFPRWGGRGIRVCDRWRESFVAFLQDVGERPSRKHSLDRIDNDRGYEPGNVRWATAKEQANNTRRNVWLTFRGETLTVSQWAARLGIPRERIKDRLKRGWPVERALGDMTDGRNPTPQQDVDAIRQRYAEGKVSQRQLAAEFGITQATIARIIKRQT